METLLDLIRFRAGASPTATAILGLDQQPLTYRGLIHLLEAAIGGLSRFGIRRNDRVAIVLPNGPNLAVTLLAVSSVGTSAPLNPAYSFDEFSLLLSDLKAKALITTEDATPAALKAAAAMEIPVILLTPDPTAEAGIFALDVCTGSGDPPIDFAGAIDAAVVLHTSGTTSRPKIVSLTHRNLVCSAQNIVHALELTQMDRCLNILPLFHVHGLMAALLASVASGASVICTPGFYAAEFFDWMKKFQPTWFTAVPTMHQAILRKAAACGIPKPSPLRFIRSASSALPPKVMAELEQAFGVPVIETYGMTEASAQIASNPMPPRRRKPGSVGVAAGPEVAVMDEAGQILPAGKIGEIVIRGDTVMHGYEGKADGNQKAFTNSWFRTGDQGWMDTDGYMFLTGRIKEIINRGGEKISPREIDEVLLDHPAVVEAVAFPFPHPDLGEDLAAAVVLQENATATENEIRNFTAMRLAYFKVPSRVLILSEIPKGPNGKIQRMGLAKTLRIAAEMRTAAPRPGYAQPTSEAEMALAQMWEEVLRIGQIGLRDNFFHLGGDSLACTRVVARVRRVFDVELSLIDFYEAPILADQAKLLEEGRICQFVTRRPRLLD